jgi:hypothetical protein
VVLQAVVARDDKANSISVGGVGNHAIADVVVCDSRVETTPCFKKPAFYIDTDTSRKNVKVADGTASMIEQWFSKNGDVLRGLLAVDVLWRNQVEQDVWKIVLVPFVLVWKVRCYQA